MTLRSLLALLSLVVVGLLAWELRWVLLVLFGAVVLAVALDVPVSWLRRIVRLNRPVALLVVVLLIAVLGWQLGQLLLPELLEQLNQLSQLIPQLTPIRQQGFVALLSSFREGACWSQQPRPCRCHTSPRAILPRPPETAADEP